MLSSQHSDKIKLDELRKQILEKVIKEVVPKKYIDERTKYFINPCGEFQIGGPQGDAGLTGRKIIVDTYGGWGAHGGGAFSGKDYTKVDRSAAYAARWVAKSLVKSGLCRRCLVQVSKNLIKALPGLIDSRQIHGYAVVRIIKLYRFMYNLEVKKLLMLVTNY